MKKILLIGKVLLLAVFGVLGCYSLLMFSILIGVKDTETLILRYSYLGLLLISIFVIFLISKNELKQN